MKDESAIFAKFKELHPHSKEPYDPTPENVLRWKWHIGERAMQGQVPGGFPYKIEGTAELDAIREERRATNWEDLPEVMQKAYAIIASHFPGAMVAACGSRVRGDYVEAYMPDSFRELRRAAGMAWKVASDYDFVAYTKAGPVGDLPDWADRLRYVPANEQIFIPMWDFGKLPADQHANVLHLVNTNQWKEVLKVHDKYHLSTNVYCCDLAPVKRHFLDAIKRGVIK